MKTNNAEVLNKIMTRWSAKFKAAQATKDLSNENVLSLNLFDLNKEEKEIICEFNKSNLKKNCFRKSCLT